MKEERLFQIIGELEEELILEAEIKKEVPKKKRLRKFAFIVATAACVLITIGVGIYFYQYEFMNRNQGSKSEEGDQVADAISENLPLLPFEMIEGSFGYEGYMAYSFDELLFGNPWNGNDKIMKLPVYRNMLPFIDGTEYSLHDDVSKKEELTEKLQDIKTKLGMKSTEFGSVEVDAYTIWTDSDEVWIRIGTDGITTVVFNQGIELPEGIHVTAGASRDNWYEAADYILENYKELIDMEHPQIVVEGGDYTYDGDQSQYYLTFYEGGDGISKTLTNYYFEKVTVAFNEAGKLYAMHKYETDLTDEVGEYPINDVQDAQDLLEDGKYQTSAPEDFPGTEYIQGVELVYVNGSMQEYFMPYYKFWVELKNEKQENGLHTYATYYVFAVKENYLDNSVDIYR